MGDKQNVSERNPIFKKIEQIDHKIAPHLTGKMMIIFSILMAWMIDSIILSVTATILLRLLYVRMTSDVRYISCKADTPLVISNHNHLENKEVAAVKKVVKDGHPLLKDENQALNMAYFTGTQGFVVRFNLAGLKQFETDKNFAFMQPYFKSVRNREANAFVANLLICNASEGEGFSVGLHVDTSIAISNHKTFMAHQVDVWYCQVPEQMEGGELELFTYLHPTWGEGVPPSKERAPDAMVRPQENLHVVFRGDAYHQVRKFRCPGCSSHI